MGQVLSTTSHQLDTPASASASASASTPTRASTNIPASASAAQGPPNIDEVQVLSKVTHGLRKHLPELYRQLRVGTKFDPDVAKTILDIVDKACGGLPWPAGLALQAVLFLADNALQAHDNATTGGSLASTIEEVKQKLQRLRDLQVPDEHQLKVKQITLELVAASAVVDDIVKRASASWTCRTCLHAFVCAQCNARKLLDITAGLEKLLSSIKHIVSDIAIDRTKRPSDKPPELPYHLVRMEEQVTKVMNFLSASEGSTRVVGLHGEGGIGKTTLMHAIEDKLKDESSGKTHKIAVVEVGMQDQPIFSNLQQEMYRQLTAGSNKTFSSTAQGRAELQDLFHRLKREGKKVCVFLDNVWRCEHLKELLPDRHHLAAALPPGSYLLISSRSADVAAMLANMCFETKHQEREGYLDYQLQMLSKEQAADLFIQKASRKGEEKPLQKDDPLVQAIVPQCGGLPLALAVYGSYFQNEKMRKPEKWKSVLKQLQRAEDLPSGDDRVFKKLKDSIVFLQHDGLQDAFLDAALLFCHKSFAKIKLAVQEDELDCLMDQSLISERDGKVVVHDLFLVVAKQMAKERNISFVTGHTSQEEIVELIDNPQVSSIRAFDEEVWCRYAENKYPSKEQIQKLRYLKLNNSIRDQRREFSLMITKACHEVRSLELQVEDEHCSWIANLKDLRVLSIMGDSFAGISKIASQLGTLARLCLSGCKSLVHLPEGLGQLGSLAELDLSLCTSLVDLPEGLAQLGSLKELDLSLCTSLVDLPEGLVQLGSLTVLLLSGCTSLAHLPEGLGWLGSLLELGLSRCTSLAHLPDGLGRLGSLTWLDLSGCTSLAHLPDGLGQLGSLTWLDLSGCTSLAHLPEGLGQLGSLTWLGLSGCTSLAHLPEGLGRLGSLTRLDLSGCTSLTHLPEGLGLLGSLTRLDLSECTSLVHLPEGLGRLGSLTWLELSGCTSLAPLSEGLGQLGYLMGLGLSGCTSLAHLPEGLGRLGSLTDLDLSGCTSLAHLPEGLGQLGSLTWLDLSGCTSLAHLPEGLGRLGSLMRLELSGCTSLAHLPEGLGRMGSLT